jgi:hypothetical protein
MPDSAGLVGDPGCYSQSGKRSGTAESVAATERVIENDGHCAGSHSTKVPVDQAHQVWREPTRVFGREGQSAPFVTR